MKTAKAADSIKQAAGVKADQASKETRKSAEELRGQASGTAAEMEGKAKGAASEVCLLYSLLLFSSDLSAHSFTLLRKLKNDC